MRKNERIQVPSVFKKIKKNSSLWDVESQASDHRNGGDKKRGNLFEGNCIAFDIKGKQKN